MAKVNDLDLEDLEDQCIAVDMTDISKADNFGKKATIEFLRCCIKDAEAGFEPDLVFVIPNLVTMFGVDECKKALRIAKAMEPSEFGQIWVAIDPSEDERPLAMVRSILSRPL